MPTETIDSLVLAAAEACNNVILHARGGSFTVSVVVDADRAAVAVADDGPGFEPPVRPAMPAPHATGNRGLALMGALVEHVDVSSDGAGTTVVLEQSFGTPDQRASIADPLPAGEALSARRRGVINRLSWAATRGGRPRRSRSPRRHAG